MRTARLRSNPAYTLVDFDALPHDQRLACDHFRGDPEFFGVLVRSAGDAASVKAVQSGDAFFFLVMREPQRVPVYFYRTQPDFDSYLRRFIIDSIVEIEVDGTFRSGPGVVEAGSAGALDERCVSDRALLHVASLPIPDAVMLAGRLYFFNRLPTTVADCVALPDRHAVRRLLGIGDGISLESDVDWIDAKSSDPRSAFQSWTNAHSGSRVDSPFKLFFCLYPADVPAIFRRCATIAGRHGAFAMKVAADRPTLNRPDKWVAYYNTLDDLRASIEELQPVVAGLPVHELPFSAASPVPALRWGLDPPTAASQQTMQSESWRVWITRKIAGSIVRARENGFEPDECAAFAKQRLALDGVDVESWSPIGVPF